MDRDGIDLKNPILAAVLAWMVPGLGHAYQRRFGKAILFFVCVMGLFGAGFYQASYRNVFFRWDETEWRWPYFAQLGAGLVALPALVHDPALRRWLPYPWSRIDAQPSEEVLDHFHQVYGKRMDIALVYTMVAGLLNILAIYDAFAGPAGYAEERKLLAGESQTESGDSA